MFEGLLTECWCLELGVEKSIVDYLVGGCWFSRVNWVMMIWDCEEVIYQSVFSWLRAW